MLQLYHYHQQLWLHLHHHLLLHILHNLDHHYYLEVDLLAEYFLLPQLYPVYQHLHLNLLQFLQYHLYHLHHHLLM
tara:strand:- start:129 stop:356 length:228 start_codon:yes stop_codon:yes gene_type:complete